MVMRPANPPLGSFEVEDALTKLNQTEKIALLSGRDFWHTVPVHRLGIPSIRLSDGPNGVRGTRFFNGIPAACFPCGTAIAATWDTELIKKGGVLQGEEAKAKGTSVILGPTVNMQRSPLGGRGFESFSEDPYLAGAMGAAVVNGIQSTGVSATIKHYVANDQEHQRQSVNAIVSERALREIYLMPFQIAQRDASPWCYMTAYNRVNGTHVSESPRLIRDVLRKEWGFDGLVMSDWFGTYSTSEAIKAGLDLEMPGPPLLRGAQVAHALGCRKLLPRDIDACVRELLKLIKKVQPLSIPEDAEEGTIDTPATASTLRTIGANSLVLLKNTNSLLPFNKSKSTAIIGPNAAIAAYCGGGSAALAPYHAITPLSGLQAQCSNTTYTLGAPGWKKLPVMSLRTLTSHNGKEGVQGMTMKVFLDPPSKPQRQQIDEVYVKKSDILLVDYQHPRLPEDLLYYVSLLGTFIPDQDSEYEFSLSVAGTGKLYVDGDMVVDNETKQTAGDSFFGAGTIDEVGRMQMTKGRSYEIQVDFGTLPTMTFRTPGTTGFGAGGLCVGLERVVDYKTELDKAVTLAKQSEQVVLCMGLNSDWESEGYDRDTMALPPGSDSLISAVCAANPNTAVIIQSGTPVSMPWRNDANAIVQAWYGGNETGHAIADVVFGDVNPGGKLPLSFPVREEDNPAFLNYRAEKGRTIYGEDVYVGYRFYEKTQKAVAFAFGHGLSYTTFEISDLSVSDGEQEITVSATVSNTGERDGSEVVQVYISQQEPSINRPPKELKGFTKVHVKKGGKENVQVKISKKYATSFFDEERESWVMEKDSYQVWVGGSSEGCVMAGKVEVGETGWWNGL